MASLEEAAKVANTQLSSVLHSAVETISSDQTIKFKLYVKQVLPIDGFVYWVNADILNQSELKRLNVTAAKSLIVKGSLHRQVVSRQDETTSFSVDRIIFTPLSKIDDFDLVDPQTMYIGEFDAARFNFSLMHSKYTQAGIFHYEGVAVLPTMETQLIDKIEDIPDKLVLSNSVPIWLSLNKFSQVYPSFLSPANLYPPYIVADVKETKPLQIGSFSKNNTRWQWVQDKVRVTLYGLNNEQALDYVDYIVQSALEDESFGVSNMPVVKDGKANQVEINVLAKQKIIEFEVNYYQATAREIAYKLIKEAICNYEVH
ncbi:hypothetical protein QE197_10915 [Arsenophonus nasoniae]|uniref:Conserved hypothetical phage protein n=1 Tax=Arsenophonus nasoniae TaxID=638 RepID=D2TYL6_9GAMM|nr:hypothetical protein [Arsenophonus nasoniae]QBY43976.1 hypothetical protein ArsFIN_25490 [Arsenophonus nasoniae]WGM04294.1 hypothetical protein QE258_11645 [Arsenophonus nasoniae]WGM09396.1 hypothetical protein QE197_10915 [Arsenophonus nasoniae]WGM14121.1 hypothetical protein QE193_10810 [Arsenophonus nasoniae]CBA72512.1 conserved hypothetical phage protein [Arsenophonus nasoniae]